MASSIVDKRIIRELKSLNDSKKDLIDNGIHFWFDEANIRIIYALFIGQDNTPYYNGFFIISFKFPDNYPWEPPIAKFETQGYCESNTSKPTDIRFNPNLYTNGKVCLSMLNTWQGPGWTPANTIHNVFIAIQSLVLNEWPLQNEPGFENSKMDMLVEYNKIIKYATLKISVIDFIKNMLNENFEHPEYKKEFFKIIISYIKNNFDWYKEELTTKMAIFSIKPIFHSNCYDMHVKMDYELLFKSFEEIAPFIQKSD